MAGFIWGYNISGGRPLVYEFLTKDTETLTVGDMLNEESGEVDLAATNDTKMLGPLEGASAPSSNVTGQPGRITAVDSTTYVKAIVNPDAALVVVDAVARVAGVQLDIAGATGAQTVATDSNHDLFVLKDSAATEDTLVKVAEGEHYLQQT